MKGLKIERSIFLIAILGILAFHFWVASVGLEGPLRGEHTFRQSQTMLSVYWMLKDGLALDYPLPVFGYPWTVPLEFPVYQWSVWAFVKAFGTSIEFSGRVVSLLYFYLGIWFLLALMRQLKWRPIYQVGVLGMLVACPHYLFWSKMPMIESCAWAIALIWANLGVRLIRKFGWPTAIAFLLVGVLAAITKITTFLALAPVPFVYGIWFYENNVGWNWRNKTFWNVFQMPLLGLIVSLLAGQLWVIYTDAIKDPQVIGCLYSSDNLSGWNFGLLKTRFKIIAWRVILEHSQGFFFLAFLIISMGWALFSFGKIKALKWIGASIPLFLLPATVFQNLYLVHDYYQYPSLLYLVIGSGWVLGYLFDNAKKWQLSVLILVLIPFIIYESYYGYNKVYGKSLKQEVYSYFPVVDLLKNLVSDNGKVVFYSVDGNPEIAYATKKKFLLKMPREPFNSVETQLLVNEKENHPFEFLLIPIGDTGISKREGFELDKVRGFKMVESPVYVDDYINKVRVYISEERAKCLYELQLAQFDSVRKALALYKNKYGSYPKVHPDGACIGRNEWKGESRLDWIPGLAPEFLPQLPKEPRGNLMETGAQYYYISDGSSYKFFTMNPAGYYYFKKMHPEMVREANWKQVIIEG